MAAPTTRARRRPEDTLYGRVILVRGALSLALLPLIMGSLLVETAVTMLDAVFGVVLLGFGTAAVIVVAHAALERRRTRPPAEPAITL